jgi:PAS domain S-box-containing protein
MATTPTDAYAILDALFANAPVGFAFWDRELRYRRVNAALAAINGIAPADHIGRTPAELLGPVGEKVELVMRRVLETGKPVIELAIEGETPAASGEIRHWSASFYPVTGEHRELLGVAVVVVEVTTEREARRDQQVASALLDAVFGAAPVGIVLFDTDLRMRRVNPALADMHDLPAEDHLGHTPDELFGELGHALTELLMEVRESGRPVVREIAGHDGERSEYREGTVFPVYGPHGEVNTLAAVIRDVTAHHEAEAERGRLLKEALTARAQAEAAQVRSESAAEEAEAARRRTEFLARAGERLAVVTRDFEATLQEVADVACSVASKSRSRPSPTGARSRSSRRAARCVSWRPPPPTRPTPTSHASTASATRRGPTPRPAPATWCAPACARSSTTCHRSCSRRSPRTTSTCACSRGSACAPG